MYGVSIPFTKEQRRPVLQTPDAKHARRQRLILMQALSLPWSLWEKRTREKQSRILEHLLHSSTCTWIYWKHFLRKDNPMIGVLRDSRCFLSYSSRVDMCNVWAFSPAKFAKKHTTGDPNHCAVVIAILLDHVHSKYKPLLTDTPKKIHCNLSPPCTAYQFSWIVATVHDVINTAQVYVRWQMRHVRG